MVVLVILLVGIFLVVRIFPTGFGILRSNANRTLATQLAQQQMSDLRADSASLPLGVLYSTVDPGTGGLTFATNLDPDNLAPCRALGNDTCTDDATGTPTKNGYFSDINKFRYIKGEGVKIPLPTVGGQYGTGSVYACKFGPLFINQQVGEPANAPAANDAAARALYDSYLAVYGAPLIGINVESDDPNAGSYIRDQQTYLITYGNDTANGIAQIWLPTRAAAGRTNPNRTFRITISTYSNNGVKTAQADPILIGDDAAGWRNITIGGNGVTGAVAGSETVTRAFDRLPANVTWDAGDPYQYKLLSPNVLTNQSSDSVPTYANVGILSFNPSGANYSETTTSGQAAFKAYIDYAVLDWHILRDNREIPAVIPDSNGLISIRTTLGFIKKAGDPNDDTTIYAGLFGKSSDDIQIFNLSATDGKALIAGKLVNGVLTPAGRDYYISDDERGGTYRTGTIYINPARIAVGSKLRILYKAEGEWAVGMQKAYSEYRLNTTPNNANVPAQFPIRGRYDGFSLFGKGAAAEIRLPLADFNKSVVATIQYTTPTGAIKRLSPIQMTASGRGSGAVDAAYDNRWATIPVSQYLPLLSRSDFASATSWQVIGTLSGVSVKSRVIWRDNDSNENRWRVQDTDTYVK